MSSFQLYLPSTASHELYNNSPSHFKVQLPEPLHLQGRWECGITELILPSYWRNLSDRTDTIIIRSSATTAERKEGGKDIVLQVKRTPGARLMDAINQSQSETQYFRINLRSEMGSMDELSEQYYAEVTVREGYKVKLPSYILKLLNLSTNSGGFIVEYTKSLDPFSVRTLDDFDRKFNDFQILVKSTTKPDDAKLVVRIPHGYYPTPQSVFDVIKTAVLEGIFHSEQFQQDAVFDIRFRLLQNRRVEITASDNLTYEFPARRPGLGLLLGLSSEQIGKPLGGNVRSAHTVDISGGIHSFFIYSSLIKEQIIGNQKGPLIKMLPPGENNEQSQIHKIYNSPDMFPLSSNTISTIETLVATDHGERVRFLHGKSFIKLLFRKVE